MQNKMKSKINFSLFISLILLTYSCKPGKEKLKETIAANEQKLFNESTKMLDTATANQILNSYLDFTNRFPDDTLAAGYFFKAGDLYNGMKKYKEAIDVFEQFRLKFPTHRKVPVSLFLEAFIYDNNLHDVEHAKLLYSDFLQKYPSHELARSAQASLNQLNMGLSDEELVRMFEAKNDSLLKAGK